MRAVKLNHVGLLIVMALILGIMGCGDSGKSEIASLSGTWQNPKNNNKIVINSTSEKKTMVIAEKTLPVTIKPFEVDRYRVHISDAAMGEKDWKIYRIWDDIGKNFTLRFEHDGLTEELERVQG